MTTPVHPAVALYRAEKAKRADKTDPRIPAARALYDAMVGREDDGRKVARRKGAEEANRGKRRRHRLGVPCSATDRKAYDRAYHRRVRKGGA